MKVRTKITQEQIQDLRSSTGIDVAVELENILVNEIVAAEKRESIRKQREEKINTILDGGVQ